ncbi:hypothetical protein EVAR_95607_1 [Eumeta japonica]|uniref:Uncharacterized protein n=1 Tax=Eumeta variegata TaxID=151549 RepID=A0A4C1VL20_EUMVA|nr:hypothetical protein EVAR_95607_1 [Eumeta japonica]
MKTSVALTPPRGRATLARAEKWSIKRRPRIHLSAPGDGRAAVRARPDSSAELRPRTARSPPWPRARPAGAHFFIAYLVCYYEQRGLMYSCLR